MMDTPSKLLRVDSSDNVSFQLDEVFALLKTPLHERERIKASVINNPDTVSLFQSFHLSGDTGICF